MQTYRKGFIYEIDLVRKLRRLGWYTIRYYHSGHTPTQYEILRPDIVAIKHGRALFIECKVRKDNRHIHIELDRYKKMLEDIIKYGVVYLLCVYYEINNEWRCVDIRETSWLTDRYAVFARKDIVSRGLRPEDLDRLVEEA